jgi:hypothetical protein
MDLDSRGMRLELIEHEFEFSTARIFVCQREPHPDVEIADHFILGRRQVSALQPGATPVLCDSDELVQHFILRLPFQHPAAHQPRIDIENGPHLFRNDNGNQPVIAEPILQPA